MLNNENNLSELQMTNHLARSPIRNRLILELNEPPANVWALVGNPSNMPQYSDGLHKVETKYDAKGNCTGYTCYFKPADQGQEGIIHSSEVVWHEKFKGWASIDSNNNPFGLMQSLSLMTLESSGNNTLFTWQFHFNCANEQILNLNKNGYQQALEDISQHLIERFGGTLIENHIETSYP